jgi:hypothetical protein
MADDLYAQFGVSPKDYFIDPETNTIKRKELALPTIPELPDNRLIDDFQVSAGSKIGNKLFGTGGEERYQTWPERMVRSGSTIAGDVYSGAVPITDDSGHTSQPVIERVQDMAGLAGMSSIPLAEKGALGAIGGKFYSTLENTIAGSKVQKATPEQWTSYLKNQPGVKPEELEFSLTGLGDKPLTKEQLAQHVADNGIKFNENLNPTYQGKTNSYSQWQLPGGENYRELTLNVPNKAEKLDARRRELEALGREATPEQKAEWVDIMNKIQPENRDIEGLSRYKGMPDYKSSHWDEPNVLAHIRMNDREVPGVGKTLHVEEIQSDWHQAGRKQGYFNPEAEKALTSRLDTAYTKLEDARAELRNRKEFPDMPEIDRILIPLQEEYRLAQEAVRNAKSGVPNAPFKKTWDELALKRVLSEAATKGYDAVSWTPGEAQAARYDLSKHYDNITATKRQDGSYNISGTQKGHKTSNALADRVTEDKLADTVGKELAEKIIKDNKEGLTGAIEYSGVELKVGGEGMKAFYDTMLPAKANALIKKMGGKVEYENLPADKSKIKKNEIRPDEEAQTKYAKAWDEYTKEINKLTNNGRNSEAIKSNEVKALESERDGIHDLMVEETVGRMIENLKGDKIPIIKITPQMRETIANKGFPLYSSGVPTFTPVSDDPFKRKPRLVKVDHNPFENTE